MKTTTIFKKAIFFFIAFLFSVSEFVQAQPETQIKWAPKEEAEFNFYVSYSIEKCSTNSNTTMLLNTFNEDETHTKVGFILTKIQANESFTNYEKFNTENDEWILHTDVDGVKAYYKITSCDNESVVFLKFESTHGRSIKIEWKDAVLLRDLNDLEMKVESESPKVFYINEASVSASSCENEPNIQLVYKLDTEIEIDTEGEEEISLVNFSIKKYDFKDLIITIN